MEKVIFKIFKPLLEFIIIIFLIISILSFCFIIKDAIQLKFCLNNSNCLLNFINLFKKFAGLYSATFLVSASYYAIYQLIELKVSNNSLVFQTNITSQDIINRMKRESINKTVEECKFFYNDIQPKIRDLYQDFNKVGFIYTLNKWEINDFTWEELNSQDKVWREKIESLSSTHRVIFSDIILTLNKIEAFATSFTQGIADKDVGMKAIGYLYQTQIEEIYPLIAIVRSKKIDVQDMFYNNLVELYRLWKRDQKTDNK
jgi:hypothetical protein